MASEEGVTTQELEDALKSRLSAVHTQVSDISGGCGQSYEVVIVSPVFAKKMTLARHRLVNTALKDEIARLHAFSQKSYTPEEWEALQNKPVS